MEIPLVAFGDFLERHFSSLVAWAPAMLFPGVMLYVGCLLIWRPVVTRTRRRRLGLLGISLAFLSVLLLAGTAPQLLRWQTDSAVLTLLSSSLIASGLALWAMAWICHDPAEPAKVACPSCGYDLRGQQECRCPECGEQFTVGELAGGRAGDEP
jgi:hypothetical protein